MGRLAVTAVLGSDYAVVQASVFVAALLITGINLLADTTTIAIDPRLRN
jgi:ABC-type dipeptide/oligopeptide/nickel transport system permease component